MKNVCLRVWCQALWHVFALFKLITTIDMSGTRNLWAIMIYGTQTDNTAAAKKTYKYSCQFTLTENRNLLIFFFCCCCLKQNLIYADAKINEKFKNERGSERTRNYITNTNINWNLFYFCNSRAFVFIVVFVSKCQPVLCGKLIEIVL